MKIKAPDFDSQNRTKRRKRIQGLFVEKFKLNIATDANAKRANELCPLPPGEERGWE
jgi:hypothetical protein